MILGRAATPGRIVVVHADAAHAEATAQLLRPAGHRVTTVTSTTRVVEQVLAATPDLLIGSAVLQTPRLSQVVRAVRRVLGELPVVVLAVSGVVDDDPFVEADEVVREPSIAGELNLRVATLLRTRAQVVALHRSLREQQALNRVARALTIEASAQELYGHLTTEAGSLLDVEVAVLLTWEQKTGELVAQQRARGLSAAQVAALRYAVRPEPRLRWNFRTNGALLSNDAERDTRLVPELVSALGLTALVAVPLIRGSGVLGILLVGTRRRERRFDDADLDLLQRMAAESTIGVENLRLHEHLKHANALLQEYDRRKSEFVAIVAHDFRRPLMAIRGFAELILEETDLPVETRQEYMHTVMVETDGLARLADDTLLITEMETGDFQFQFREVDLGPFILECMPLGLSQHSVLAEVPPDFPRLVSDADRLRQVVTNLMSNAVKYSPEGGTITVRCQERPAGFVEITISDRGLGVPPEQVPRLFQKFARVRGTAHLAVTGTGLGLYICRLIVEGLGGRIWVESTPGEGSTFAFCVPLEARVATAERSAEPAGSAAGAP